ncbi:MAG TPA: ABC-type transport auxiliary lipoprotein family protein [Steroidobacteraceae bacterium]
MNRLLLVFGCIVPTLAGCLSTGGKQPAAEIYTLTAPAVAPANAAAAPTAVLSVLRPDAAAGLHSERIALLQAGHRLDYFAASRWSGSLPELVQSLAMDALRGGGQYRSVQTDTAPFAADYVLQLQIRHFEADYSGGGAPVAHVAIDATLGRSSDRAIVQTLTAESSVPAASDRMVNIINAFEQASSTALQQLATGLQPPH